MPGTGDLATAITDIGGAVSQLFGARAATASASSYDTAASIAEQNAQLTQEATAIKETQASRQIYQTVGAQKAAVGGAGFAESGSALDLLRSSASQGALTKAILANQGAITENAYAEQAGMFRGMAEAAGTSAKGQNIGALLQGAGGLISLGTAAYNGYNAVTGATGGAATAVGAGYTLASAGGAGTVASTGIAADVAAGDMSLAGGTAVATDAGVASSAALGADAAASGGFWSAVGDYAGAAVAACFITTAIVRSLGKPDDCDELETLRNFRDTWLAEHYPEDIEEYYAIAPGIVRAIAARPDAAQVWASMYVDYLKPAISSIKHNEFNAAHTIYRGMVKHAQGMTQGG